ncbi:SMI1/KNR4 family protein [Micromonospora siamensis]|uniref:hypothetical protein n=1 Tax=Micromonospora siamensis TaxID=299152 RepID=UPI0012FDC613|nr:hypothetical protein [Micromonospora siamensis]
MWTDRIVDVTGWRQAAEGPGWEQVEAELGVALPTDFKELSRRFVPGAFSGYLDLLRPTDEHFGTPLLSMWFGGRQMAVLHGSHARLREPYRVYGPDTGPGLVQWGIDISEGDHFWLVDRSVEPERWPVVSRRESGESWHQFDMSTAEFVYRVIADPEFKPFTVADPPRLPFYLPYWAPYPPSPAEWAALTSPNREARPCQPSA